MQNTKMWKTAGKWAWWIGIPVSALFGLLKGFGIITGGTWLITLAVISGLVIGFLNITQAESVPYMIAVMSLAIGAGAVSGFFLAGGWLDGLLTYFGTVAGSSVLPVAITMIYKKANN